MSTNGSTGAVLYVTETEEFQPKGANSVFQATEETAIYKKWREYTIAASAVLCAYLFQFAQRKIDRDPNFQRCKSPK